MESYRSERLIACSRESRLTQTHAGGVREDTSGDVYGSIGSILTYPGAHFASNKHTQQTLELLNPSGNAAETWVRRPILSTGHVGSLTDSPTEGCDGLYQLCKLR